MKLNNLNNFLKIQFIVFIYSLVSLFSKISSNFMGEYGFFSFQFILSLSFMILMLAIYALLWQGILKKNPLSFAYINKGTQLIWSIFWTLIVFKEGITIFNILGTIIVLAGIYMVNKNDETY